MLELTFQHGFFPVLCELKYSFSQWVFVEEFVDAFHPFFNAFYNVLRFLLSKEKRVLIRACNRHWMKLCRHSKWTPTRPKPQPQKHWERGAQCRCAFYRFFGYTCNRERLLYDQHWLLFITHFFGQSVLGGCLVIGRLLVSIIEASAFSAYEKEVDSDAPFDALPSGPFSCKCLYIALVVSSSNVKPPPIHSVQRVNMNEACQVGVRLIET